MARATKLNDTSRLINMIYRLVEIIRYDNTYAYRLLKEVTLNKTALIKLDKSKLLLTATGNDDNYHLKITPVRSKHNFNFITTSLTLRKIMAGIQTVDYAIIKNEIFLSAEFTDLVNIYRLTTCLLAQGPWNLHLRNLWEEFDETWHNNIFSLALRNLENQHPQHALFINAIPDSILFPQ